MQTSAYFKGVNRQRYVYDWFRIELTIKEKSHLFRLFETHEPWEALVVDKLEQL